MSEMLRVFEDEVDHNLTDWHGPTASMRTEIVDASDDTIGV